MTDPFKILSESLQIWTSATRRAQENWLQLVNHQVEQAKTGQGVFPIPHMNMAMDETKIRDMFQTAADTNLNAWTEMAEKIAALPSWVRWPTEVPGRALTDMFDMMRPFPVFDSGNTSPEKTAETLKPLEPMTIDHRDDLTEIKGIGPKIAEKLETLGIVRFAQIATWSETEALQADIMLSLGGRIERQNWIAQAKQLAKPLLH
ncbi:MAG: hypothetical protein ABJG15_11445 [Hyphomonadaceae bacterium]